MSDAGTASQSQSAISDAGGVAARHGFRYQDHIAAKFVLEMISDPKILQVECETSDDITIQRSSGKSDYPEYIQVKTTDKDSKWSITEISDRESKPKDEIQAVTEPKDKPKKGKGKVKNDNPNSLIEKSLLCDCYETGARFRIVSSRAVRKELICLTLGLEQRDENEELQALVEKFSKKWATVSANNNDLGYWTRHALWEVTGDEGAVEAINHKKIMEIAEHEGVIPAHSHMCSIYTSLLDMVEKAARASRVKAPAEKVISRAEARAWWEKQLAEADAARLKTAKAYRIKTEGFFTELHHITEDEIRRALTGYDTRYELKKWRSEQLADYLVDWLPEMALPASELLQVQQLTLRQKLKDALKVIESQREINIERLLAEMLLHAVIRHQFKSDPIGCKLFYKTASGNRTFGNAHIVRGQSQDELWLGCATIAPASSYDEVVTSVMEELGNCLDPDLLKEEREVILHLRQPQHLRPTNIWDALKRNTPVDDLLAILCISVLIAYDSASLDQGFTDDYREKLMEEVASQYEALKQKLPANAQPIKVHIFLVPMECVKTLVEHFSAKIEKGGIL